jgi:hypothetical protein
MFTTIQNSRFKEALSYVTRTKSIAKQLQWWF